MFDTIEKMGELGQTLSYAMSIIGTILFLIYVFGVLLTQEGRYEIKGRPFMAIFIILMFTFGYFYWFSFETILQYLHIDPLFIRIGYFTCCIFPMIEKSIVN